MSRRELSVQRGGALPGLVMPLIADRVHAMVPIRILVALALLMPLLSAAEPGVRFTSTSVELRPQPEAESASATWDFTNTSERSVTFTPLPCRCTALRVSPNPCPPGVTGTVTAEVPIGEQAGRYERQLRLASDLPGQSEITLTLVLHLPHAPSILPTFVRWEANGPAATRAVAVAMPAEATMTMVRAESADPRLRVELVPGERPRTWTLRITPTTTAEPFNTRVELISDDQRRFRVYARVM